MADIHLNSSGNANIRFGSNSGSSSVSLADSSMPKYVGARAVVDKVDGKVRITLTDYMGTTQEIIEAGGEANVQSDWAQSDSTKSDYIKNKPAISAIQIVRW